MLISFSDLTPSQRYLAMTQAIIPRPIAWVLSDNGEGHNFNLAPFSFFTAICSDPPLLLISGGKKTTGKQIGRFKDTVQNIHSRKNFVVHISDETQLDAVNQSSAALDHGVSEVNELGLPLSDFDGFSLPRLADCAIAFGCRLHRLDEIGNAPQAVIYGEIQTMYVDERVLLPDDSGKLVIDPRKMKPLARMGGAEYSTLGELLSAKRPT